MPHALQERAQSALTWIEQRSKPHDRDNLASFGITAALWETGWYEARVLTSFVDEPEGVTPSQMDRWCRDFDNWGICDTVCFHLFDRSPHAWQKVAQWCGAQDEFVKRAGIQPFLESLHLIEQAATDERNFVKKGVSRALRRIGGRSAVLSTAAVALARRLADSPDAAARWVGKDTLRVITRPIVTRKFAARGKS